MNRVGVIFVNYHTEKEISKIYEQFALISEITDFVIVDNSPSSENRKFFRRSCPLSVVFESKRNVGYSRANNYAMRFLAKRGCEYFIIANSDICIASQTLTALIHTMQSHREYGVLAPAMYDNEGKMVELRTIPLDFKRAWRRLFRGLDKDSLKVLPCVDGIVNQSMVSGSFFIASAEAMKDCGYFDPNIFLYREEEILGERMKRAGYKLGVIANLRYIHLHDYTKTPLLAYCKQLKQECISERYFFKKYLGCNNGGMTLLVILQLLFVVSILKSVLKNKLIKMLRGNEIFDNNSNIQLR